MLPFCPYWAYLPCKFNISECNWWYFEMYLFGFVNFELSSEMSEASSSSVVELYEFISNLPLDSFNILVCIQHDPSPPSRFDSDLRQSWLPAWVSQWLQGPSSGLCCRWHWLWHWQQWLGACQARWLWVTVTVAGTRAWSESYGLGAARAGCSGPTLFQN